MNTLYWFWPERTRPQSVLEDEEGWDNYGRAAEAAGLRLELISVDDVDIVADPVRPRAYVKGEPTDPREVVFHNKLYTWPMFQADAWRSLALFEGLAGAGYHLLVRPELNLISNDKASTLLHLREVDACWLPTMSLPTREFTQLRVQLSEAGIGYPVVVKPASWGSGKGVIRADSEPELLMALRLAGAAELTMVVQPFLAPAGELADLRVYCIDGEPASALRRTVGSGGTVANVTSGGRAELVAVPPELTERASAIAAWLDTPWLAVDFLSDGCEYYLSEVEIDAYVGPVTAQLSGMADIMAARFRAYRARFDRCRAGTVPATSR